MNLSSYYRCSLFNQSISNLYSFSFVQEELLLKNTNNKNAFSKVSVEYVCKFVSKYKLGSKPVAIIPIKDNPELLSYTLENIKKYNIFDSLDFIVVDDRSTENIENICRSYPVSYLRVDNKKGFNFSTLNNIAAKIAHDAGCKLIVFWNSDLWVENAEFIPYLLNKHQQYSCTISGTKLLYPNKSFRKEERQDLENIFNQKNYKGTVQFGGSHIINKCFMHAYRFAPPSYYLVNVDKPEFFITGAFKIIDLEWYITCGGLNPSLSKNYQDVDLCLKATKENKLIYYFGKDIHLLHDESYTLNKEGKNDLQLFSDYVLYEKIWFNEFNNIIYKLEEFNK